MSDTTRKPLWGPGSESPAKSLRQQIIDHVYGGWCPEVGRWASEAVARWASDEGRTSKTGTAKQVEPVEPQVTEPSQKGGGQMANTTTQKAQLMSGQTVVATVDVPAFPYNPELVQLSIDPVRGNRYRWFVPNRPVIGYGTADLFYNEVAPPFVVNEPESGNNQSLPRGK